MPQGRQLRAKNRELQELQTEVAKKNVELPPVPCEEEFADAMDQDEPELKDSFAEVLAELGSNDEGQTAAAKRALELLATTHDKKRHKKGQAAASVVDDLAAVVVVATAAGAKGGKGKRQV